MQCAVGCDTCDFLQFGLQREADAISCCSNPRIKKTLAFWVDTCESALLSEFCIAVSSGNAGSRTVPIKGTYAGSMAAPLINCGRHYKVSAIEILVNGPRRLFLSATNTLPAGSAVALIQEISALTRYGAKSLALSYHLDVVNIVTLAVKNKQLGVVTEFLKLRPETLQAATHEAWLSSSLDPDSSFLRNLTLCKHSAHEAAFVCASKGRMFMLRYVLERYRLGLWESSRVMRAAACSKPPTKAAIMVHMLQQMTEYRATNSFLLAAATGNAGAALTALGSQATYHMLNAAASRAAFNYYEHAAKILAPKPMQNNLIAVMIARCKLSDMKWYPYSSAAQFTDFNCLWPLMAATPRQLLLALYGIGHRIRNLHMFLLHAGFSNNETQALAHRLISGIGCNEEELLVAASTGLTREAASAIVRRQTHAPIISSILTRKINGKAPLYVQNAILITMLCFNQIAGRHLPPQIGVTLAGMIL